MEVVASSIEKNEMPDAIYYIMASAGLDGRATARTVALRGILTDKGWKMDPSEYAKIPSHLLHFSAKRDSTKVKAMVESGDNRVELVKFYPKTKQQIRLAGVMHIRFADQKTQSEKLDFPADRLFNTYIKPYIPEDQQQMNADEYFDLQRKKLWVNQEDRIRTSFGSIPPKEKVTEAPKFCLIGPELKGDEDEETKEWYHRAWNQFCHCLFEPERVELMEMQSGGKLRIWTKENDWQEDFEWS